MQFRTVPEEVGNDLSKLTVVGCCQFQNFHLHKRVVRGLTRIIALTLVVVSSGAANGDQLQDLAKKAGIRILADGESSGDSQKKTVASFPLRQMSPVNRQRAQQIIENCSQYRKLPTLQYAIDEPIYKYLLEHPDVAVSTWRVMGISRFEMWQTGPMEYEAKAVDGSEGMADILYQDPGQMVFVCDGTYHNPLLPRPLQASALIWFRAVYAPNAEGTHVVTQKADVFVRFPSAGFSAVAKMLTPVTNSMMDRNLFEVSLYSSMMSRAVRDEPEWVIQVADQMDGVLPQRRGELADVARMPRAVVQGNATDKNKVTSVDRSMIMSPQLLFFDPPKSGVEIVKDSAVRQDSSSRTAELPASKTGPSSEATNATPVSTSSGSPMVIQPASMASPARATLPANPR